MRTLIKLTPHFDLDEMTTSQYGARNGLDNTPGADQLANLRVTATGMEMVRSELNDNVIQISSAFRSVEINKAIGGVGTSQHCEGKAVDFKCPAFGTPRDIVDALRKSNIKFDQLILEFWTGGQSGWVHISFSAKPRRQCLVIDRRGTRPFV
jgi:zinc D-Ala-D-Ala carboxypeptidase